MKQKAKLILISLCTNEKQSILDIAKEALKIAEIDYFIVVDNQSSDGSAETLNSLNSNKIIIIHTDKDGGYGYGINVGFRYVFDNFETEYILTCNADILINEESIIDCLNYMDLHSGTIAVSSLMKNKNGKIDLNWGYSIRKKDVFNTATFFALRRSYSKLRKKAFDDLAKNDGVLLVPWIRGSFEMFRASVLSKSKLYDENIFMYGEENVLRQRLAEIQDGNFAILPSSYYIHNHVGNDSNWKERRKYIKSSRLYYLKHYLKGNVFETSWYQFLFCIGNIEYSLIHLRQKIKSRKRDKCCHSTK